MQERRAARRFDMRLPLRITDPESPERELRSEARDLSHRGVYFWFDRNLSPGSEFEFVLVLPSEITTTIPVQVRCVGKVIRSLPDRNGRIGVAARIERYEFLRSATNLFRDYPSPS